MSLPVLVAFAIALLLMLNSVAGSVNCRQSPSSLGQNCCTFPTGNWAAFEEKCKEFKPLMGNPCFLECMFNVSNAVIGDEFQMENARQTFSTLFNGNQEFVDAYVLGFKQCEPFIKNLLAAYKAKSGGELPKMAQCELHGYFYGICAHEMMLVNCPKSAWHSFNKGCEQAKATATKCIPLSYLGN